MRSRPLFIGVVISTLAIFATSCGVDNPSDTTKPDAKTARQITGSAPFCDLVSLKDVEAWAHDDLLEDLPAYHTNNAKHQVPQYTCTYNGSGYDDFYTVTTTAERPGSSLVFDYIVKRYDNVDGYKTVDYANYRGYSTGLTKSELNQLKAARALVNQNDDSLAGLIFKIGTVIVVDQHATEVSASDMNKFVSKQLASLKKFGNR